MSEEIKFPRNGMSDQEFIAFLGGIEEVCSLQYDVDRVQMDGDYGYVIVDE